MSLMPDKTMSYHSAGCSTCPEKFSFYTSEHILNA